MSRWHKPPEDDALASPLLGKDAHAFGHEDPEEEADAKPCVLTPPTCSPDSSRGDPAEALELSHHGDDEFHENKKDPGGDGVVRGRRACGPPWLTSLLAVLLALGGMAASIWAILSTRGDGDATTPLGYSIWVYISCGLCLFSAVMVVKNERIVCSARRWHASREAVQEAMARRRRLERENDRLVDEVENLARTAHRREYAHIKLRGIVEVQASSVEGAVRLVRENEGALDLIRERLRRRAVQEVVRIVIEHCDANEVLDDSKAKALAAKIQSTLVKYSILFDEDRFQHALAMDATFIGALRTVRRLLPPEAPSPRQAPEVGETDIYDMFALPVDDQRQQGSYYAARAAISKEDHVSLAPTPRRTKRHTGIDDEWDDGGAKDDDSLPREYKNRAREQLHQFWIMALPYFRETSSGKCLIGTLIVLSFISSGVNVYFSYLFRDFSTALAEKHAEEFYHVVAKFLLSLIFMIPLQVSFRFIRVKLAIAWRKWLTERVLALYFSNKVYYGLERQSKAADSSARDYKDRRKDMDNPDQRIQEDVAAFTGESLNFLLTILNTTLNLVSFCIILFSIMPELFIAIILFAGIGTLCTVAIGKVLIKLNYEELQRSADFRFSLVRVREHAESIAFYRGEAVEQGEVRRKFNRVIDNNNAQNWANLRLDSFTTLYNHLVNLLPLFILSHQYFVGMIEFGVIAQTRGAFGQVLNDFSLIIHQFNGIANFMAGIDRLFLFMKAIQELDSERPNGDSTVAIVKENVHPAEPVPSEGMILLKEQEELASPSRVSLTPKPILTMRNLQLVTPDHKRVLIENLNLSLIKGKNLLISGVSGAGKSSLLRAIAGLWQAGGGEISRSKDVYFLPQKPYCPPGTLRDQLLYPSSELRDGDDDHYYEPMHADLSDEELLSILNVVELPDLASRSGDGDPVRGLNSVSNWTNVLSLGEQQRLAFGRLLVNRPRLVVLDESTSALDVVAERKMYALLKERLISEDTGEPATYVSVGHRPTLLAYHDVKLLIRDGAGSASFIPQEGVGSDPDSILRSLPR